MKQNLTIGCRNQCFHIVVSVCEAGEGLLNGEGNTSSRCNIEARSQSVTRPFIMCSDAITLAEALTQLRN